MSTLNAAGLQNSMGMQSERFCCPLIEENDLMLNWEELSLHSFVRHLEELFSRYLKGLAQS
jgi:hypothetical protein